jgi:hypothetical protein
MKRHGTVAGIPYDTRPPTVERFKSTYWSAQNPKLFPPKMDGFGWAINFYWLIHPLRWLKARKAPAESVVLDLEPEESLTKTPPSV